MNSIHGILQTAQSLDLFRHFGGNIEGLTSFGNLQMLDILLQSYEQFVIAENNITFKLSLC